MSVDSELPQWDQKMTVQGLFRILGCVMIVAIYQLMVDIYKFPKILHLGLLMALA